MAHHYSLSKAEYFRQIENASVKRDLTEFFEYSLTGLRNGLKQTLETIQADSRQIMWRQCVYDFFARNRVGHEKVAERLRRLAMSLDTDKKYRNSEIRSINSKIAREYVTLSPLTLERDLGKLIMLGLLVKEGDLYKTNSFQNITKTYYSV